MKNRRVKRAKTSEAKTRQFVRLFCEELTATQIARLSNLNRNTVNRLLKHIRPSCDALKPVNHGLSVFVMPPGE